MKVTPVIFAPVILTFVKSTLVIVAPDKLAFVKLEFVKFELLKSTPMKFTDVKSPDAPKINKLVVKVPELKLLVLAWLAVIVTDPADTKLIVVPLTDAIPVFELE